MDWRTKIALVVIVVGVGLAVALQFRKNGGAVTETSPAAAAATAAGKDLLNKSAAAQNTLPYRSTSLDHLAESTPNFGSAAGDASSQAAGSAEATGSNNPGGAATTGALVDLNAPQQTHKVVDGNTLPQLAEQYLGRADRYLEIFEYNRDVLQSPDVLPIGAELRIPSRLALSAGESGNGKSADSSTTASVSAPAAPLVPVISPTARPASSQRSGPRTYKVQPGDNLVDIARKLYGDGRRNADLFEANRHAMRNPGDLKPGMELVVP